MLEAFAQLSGDYAPVHFDTTHARTMGYDDTITHGFLLTLRFSRLLGMFLPGPNCVIQSVKFDYKRPALTSATLIYTVKLSRLSEAVKLMVLDLSINNDSGEMLVKGTAQCVMLK
jgi:3-hydroxybutyryl-CoA dehydratase